MDGERSRGRTRRKSLIGAGHLSLGFPQLVLGFWPSGFLVEVFHVEQLTVLYVQCGVFHVEQLTRLCTVLRG